MNTLIKISFFQHERFIHLVVTLFYVLMMLIFFALGNVFIGFFNNRFYINDICYILYNSLF